MILFLVALIGIFCARADPCQPPSFVRVETKDGAAICIKRYPADGRPVLIAHGISSNHRFWDLNEQYSLARYLSQKGFDVYNMDFRGHGNAIYDAKGIKQKSGWSIDSYGVYDIEAAVSYISSQNPSKPSYIGHSLGGMALISYMGHHTSEALSTIAVVGTPFDFQHKEALLRLAQKGSQYAFFTVPTPFLARFISLFNKTPAHLDHMLWGPENIAPEIRKSLFQNIVSPMTPRELHHLYRSLDAQSYVHYEGKRNYRSALGEQRIPALFIAGRADRIAPADRVYSYYDAMGSTDKKFIVAGKAHGFSMDYGHLDYSLGRSAPAEIYPILYDWLLK